MEEKRPRIGVGVMIQNESDEILLGLRYLESDGKHYLNISVKADYNKGRPKVMEAEKCKEWRWFKLDNLPKNMFEASEAAIKNFKAGKIYNP